MRYNVINMYLRKGYREEPSSYSIPQQVSIKQGNYNLTDTVKIGADPLFTQN